MASPLHTALLIKLVYDWKKCVIVMERLKSVLIFKIVHVFPSIRLVFSNARGRAQSAVTPVLLQIQTPTMRMISAVQRRIAVKVLYHSGLKQLHDDFRKPP